DGLPGPHPSLLLEQREQAHRRVLEQSAEVAPAKLERDLRRVRDDFERLQAFSPSGFSVDPSSATTGATRDTLSPSSSRTRRTPCVLREMVRMSLQRMRMVTPFSVTIIRSSLSVTTLMPTTLPLRSDALMVMMPPPPRFWSRYSDSAVRFPKPDSQTVTRV